MTYILAAVGVLVALTAASFLHRNIWRFPTTLKFF